MRPVDEKIASLKLDNKDFEAKARESLSTFGKINEKFKNIPVINTKKSADGLRAISDQANKMDMGMLRNALETVSYRFSTLGVMATTVLQNITNRVTNFSINMLKSLNVTPLMDGLQEYELKINSIQTIMSNTQGKNTMADVTAILDDLNTYADKTIYNFAEMTRNIGTFTAAGVGLEDSAVAIKGIANLAAASGSNSQQASTAMYQLSQALATGSVKLQDWNSVVNAGMGGKLFQNALQKTAEKMDINIDKSKSFRETLQSGWLTTEVLLATLKEFAEDQSMLDAATKVKTFNQLIDTTKEALGSGWAKTWELLIGDFEEASKRFTKISQWLNDTIDKSADERNKFVGQLKRWGIGDLGFDIVLDGMKMIVSWSSAVGDIFKKFFPPVTAQQIIFAMREIHEFIKKITVVDVDRPQWIVDTLKIFEALFALLKIGVTIVKEVTKAIFNLIPKSTGNTVLSLIAKLADWVIAQEKIISSGKKVGEVVSAVFKPLKRIIDGAFESIKRLTGGFKEAGGTANLFSKAVSKIAEWLQILWGHVKQVFGGMTLTDVMNAGFVGGLILLSRKIGGIVDAITGGFDGITGKFKIMDQLKGLFDGLGGALTDFSNNIKSKTLINIAISLGILAVSMKLLESIDPINIGKGIVALTATLTAMVASVGALSKVNMRAGNTIKITAMMVGLSIALLVLSSALKKISNIDPDQLNDSFKTLAKIIGTVVVGIGLLGRYGGKMRSSATSMIGLSVAILILVKAMEMIGKLDAGVISQGLKGLGIMLLEISIFMNIAGKAKFGPGKAAGVTILAAALLVMTKAVEKLGSLDIPVLAKGLGAIGLLLLEIAVFSKITSGGNLMMASVGITVVAVALNLMVGPVTKLGQLPYEQVKQGLIAMGVALVAVSAAARLAKGTMGGAAAILIVAAAVNVLVPPLMQLSGLSLAELGTALLALGGAFAVIGAAALLLGGAGGGPLMVFATGLLAIGGAIFLASAGISLFVTALVTLAKMSGEMVTNIITTLDNLIAGITGLIPNFVTLAITLVKELVRGLVETGPELLRGGLDLLTGLLRTLSEKAPEIITVGVELVTKLAESLGDNAGKLIDAGIKLIVDLVNGLADAIRNNTEAMTSAFWNLLEALLELLLQVLEDMITAIVSWSPTLSSKVKSGFDSARKGMRDAFGVDEEARKKMQNTNREIDKYGNEVIRTSGKVGSDSTKALDEKMQFKKVGKDKAKELELGALLGVPNMESAGSKLSSSAKRGAESVSLFRSGQELSNGLANGINYNAWRVREAANGIASTAKYAVNRNLQINSPSEVGKASGKWFGVGIALGIDEEKESVWNKAKGLANRAVEAVSMYAHKFSDALTSEMDFNPTITPVLELDKMKTDELDNLFGSRQINGRVTSVNTYGLDNSKLLDGNQRQAVAYNQNDYKTEVNNRGLLEGAVFHVREEADIQRVVREIDRLTDEKFAKRGIKVVPV